MTFKNIIKSLDESLDTIDSLRINYDVLRKGGRDRASFEEVMEIDAQLSRMNILLSKLEIINQEFRKIAPREEVSVK